jgi:hypothetical protein
MPQFDPQNHILFKWSTVIGYLLLTGIVILLMGSTVFEAWRAHSVGGILTTFVMIGTFYAIFIEGKTLLLTLQEPVEVKSATIIFEFLAVFVGGILSYTFSQDLGLGAVIAASLVAIIAYLIVPEFGIPAYCGAFVGMTSEILLYNHLEVAAASLGAALIFILARKVFLGAGGKLGALALIGTAVTGFGLNRSFITTPISDWHTNSIVILIALGAAPLTYYFNRRKGNGPVLASAVVGLAAGLIFPSLFPGKGESFAVVAICASFTGMTSSDRCPNFWYMILAGFITGLIFVFSTPLLGGAGGKLGTIAFASVLSVCGYSQIVQRISKSKKSSKSLFDK